MHFYVYIMLIFSAAELFRKFGKLVLIFRMHRDVATKLETELQKIINR